LHRLDAVRSAISELVDQKPDESVRVRIVTFGTRAPDGTGAWMDAHRAIAYVDDLAARHRRSVG
jgi:hypothetical protein